MRDKTLSKLELNFKRILIVVEVRFEKWEKPLSFSRGVFGHVIKRARRISRTKGINKAFKNGQNPKESNN